MQPEKSRMKVSQDVISSYRAILRRKNVNAFALGSNMMGADLIRVIISREAEFEGPKTSFYPVKLAEANFWSGK